MRARCSIADWETYRVDRLDGLNLEDVRLDILQKAFSIVTESTSALVSETICHGLWVSPGFCVEKKCTHLARATTAGTVSLITSIVPGVLAWSEARSGAMISG